MSLRTVCLLLALSAAAFLGGLGALFAWCDPNGWRD